MEQGSNSLTLMSYAHAKLAAVWAVMENLAYLSEFYAQMPKSVAIIDRSRPARQWLIRFVRIKSRVAVVTATKIACHAGCRILSKVESLSYRRCRSSEGATCLSQIERERESWCGVRLLTLMLAA